METITPSPVITTTTKGCSNCNRCPDFDEDCSKVTNHIKCYMGSQVVINGVTYSTDTSKGYCPFIHTNN